MMAKDRNILANWSAPGVQDATLDAVCRCVPREASILELGAGTGYLTSRLLAAGYNEVRAGDWNAASFKLTSVRCVKVDCDDKKGMRASFGDGGCDAIIAGDLIEHLKYPWLFLETCQSLLSDRGIMIFTTPNTASVTGRIKFLHYGYFCGKRTIDVTGHVNLLVPNLLDHMIGQVGFRLLEKKEVGRSMLLPEWSFRGIVSASLAILLRLLMRHASYRPVLLYVIAKEGNDRLPTQNRPVGVGTQHVYEA